MVRTSTILLAALVFIASSPDAEARRRGTTAASAQLHGIANVIRSRGQAARDYSRANINNEEARSRYIDNQLKWTETYFAKKAINANYVAQESSKSRQSRESYQSRRPPGAPPRLSLSQFDPITGEIFWPEGMTSPEFRLPLQPVEQLFMLRASAQAPGIVTEIRNSVAKLRDELRNRIGDMAPSEYLAARKFLDSLAYEGTLPSG